MARERIPSAIAMTTPYRPPMPPVTRTSGLAIAGFVCSFFCGLLGLILSIMGRNEIRRSGGAVQGEGLALAGIIISIVFLVLNVIGIAAAIAIPAFMDYMKTSKSSEAQLELQKIGKAATVHYTINGAYPIGQASLTPAADCCAQNFGGRRKCAPDPSQFATPVWQALEFEVDEPHYYRYAYESTDGRSFTATAVGDLDCDGTTVTYTLEGDASSGSPRTRLAEPPRNAD
jgi:type II secretory pathway pseudopilin PulG